MIIYDVLGQHVKNLFQGYQTAGFKKIKWNGKNDFGNDVNSGIYFYQLIAPGFSQTRKLVLMR